MRLLGIGLNTVELCTFRVARFQLQPVAVTFTLRDFIPKQAAENRRFFIAFRRINRLTINEHPPYPLNGSPLIELLTEASSSI